MQKIFNRVCAAQWGRRFFVLRRYCESIKAQPTKLDLFARLSTKSLLRFLIQWFYAKREGGVYAKRLTFGAQPVYGGEDKNESRS